MFLGRLWGQRDPLHQVRQAFLRHRPSHSVPVYPAALAYLRVASVFVSIWSVFPSLFSSCDSICALRQYFCFCTSSGVSVCTFVLANLVVLVQRPGEEAEAAEVLPPSC